MTKLTLDDIADLRAYEREREEFRPRIIALKKRRRVSVGPDRHLRVREPRHHPLPDPGDGPGREDPHRRGDRDRAAASTTRSSPSPATWRRRMFIELTSDEQLREWLPKLVGIERRVELRLGPDDRRGRPCIVDPDHDKQLTRDEITASVHYVHFHSDAEAVECLRRRAGGARDQPPELPAMALSWRRKRCANSSPTFGAKSRAERGVPVRDGLPGACATILVDSSCPPDSCRSSGWAGRAPWRESALRSRRQPTDIVPRASYHP